MLLLSGDQESVLTQAVCPKYSQMEVGVPIDLSLFSCAEDNLCLCKGFFRRFLLIVLAPPTHITILPIVLDAFTLLRCCQAKTLLFHACNLRLESFIDIDYDSHIDPVIVLARP